MTISVDVKHADQGEDRPQLMVREYDGGDSLVRETILSAEEDVRAYVCTGRRIEITEV